MSHDFALIMTILGVGIAMVGVMISMMFWARSEANSLRQEQKEDIKDLLMISRNLENAIHKLQKEKKG
jgi:hypothetical protein